MKIDPEEVFRLLKKGNVLYFVNEDFKGRGSYIPHFYVLLNTPNNESSNDEFSILIMVVASSKIEKIKVTEYYSLPQTLVYVEANQYSEFTKLTCFNCNMIISMTKEAFIEKYSKDQIEIKSDISVSIVSRLQEGVLASKKVAERYKKIIKREIE